MDIASHFSRFLARIRPSSAQRETAEWQSAVLMQKLSERAAAHGQFHLEKIFLAGSAAKHTNLIRSGKGTFDVDLGVYFRRHGQKDEQLRKLLAFTRACLRESYPANKPDQDFHVGKNAVNVFSRSSGLCIDVVPIIRDDSLKQENSGWIPRQDEWRLTSITAHVRFIHKRTERSNQIPGPVRFNDLVRLVKWWNRRLPENIKQCSYFCELITAAALEQSGVTGDWQSSLDAIFGFLVRHAFAQPIVFSDYYDARAVRYPHDPVVVLDAVNPENNVAHHWNKEIKQTYLTYIRQTYDCIQQARACERARREQAALDTWCKVFGDMFGA